MQVSYYLLTILLSGVEFTNLCKSLLQTRSPDEFERVVNKLHEDFPKCKSFLKWWLQEEKARLIFPAKKNQHAAISSNVRKDTNPAESMHATFYRIIGKKCTFRDGILGLLNFAKTKEDDLENLLEGYNTCYGSNEQWKDRIAIYGTSKPSRLSLFNLNQSVKVNNENTPPMRISESKRGRKRGGHNVDVKPETSYPSYRNSGNTCYLDTLLESLYACFAQSRYIQHLFTDLRDNHPWKKIFEHFSARNQAENNSSFSDSKIKSILASGQVIIKNLIIDELGIFNPGEFGGVMDSFLSLIWSLPPFENIHVIMEDDHIFKCIRKLSEFQSPATRLLFEKHFTFKYKTFKKPYCGSCGTDQDHSTIQHMVLFPVDLSRPVNSTYDFEKLFNEVCGEGSYVESDEECDICGFALRNKTWDLEPPETFLIIDLQQMRNSLMYCSTPMLLEVAGCNFQLMARPLYRHPNHFQAIVLRKDRPECNGVYMVDDLDGRGSYMNPRGYEFKYHHLMNYDFFASFAIYM